VLLFCAVSCSEVFYPNVSSGNNIMVVDGLITNEAGPFTVKLYNAVNYSSASSSTDNHVTGAVLSIIDNNGATWKLTETPPGNYTTPTGFATTIGNSYKLRITTKDGNNYESTFQKLLPPQTYDSIRSTYTTENYLDANNNLQSQNGADVRMDLFKSSSSTKYNCRFSTNLTAQYLFAENVLDCGCDVSQYICYDSICKVKKCSVYQVFGWTSGYSIGDAIDITDENTLSGSNSILNHKIGFIPFNKSDYQLNMNTTSLVDGTLSLYFYLKIAQYTLNDDAYTFYKAAKQQLSVTGKIFDPITSQLNGNITCVNNPSQKSLGMFEVSSVLNSAFFIYRDGVNTATIHKVPLINLPSDNQFRYKSWQCKGAPPLSITSEYVIIPYPSWWWHQ